MSASINIPIQETYHLVLNTRSLGGLATAARLVTPVATALVMGGGIDVAVDALVVVEGRVVLRATGTASLLVLTARGAGLLTSVSRTLRNDDKAALGLPVERGCEG